VQKHDTPKMSRDVERIGLRREFDFFDASLYFCANGHKYSTKHKILKDAEHLKIYDRTNVKGVW
jgi:hypothetical protein